MKKTIAIGSLLAITSALTVCGANATPTPTKPNSGGTAAAAATASPKDFVQGFYDWYVTSKENEPDVRGMDVALKQKKQFFDAVLYKHLWEDEAASEKSPGEVVGLDFDPFVNANGLIYNKYVAGPAVNKDGAYRVPVYGIDAGKKTPKPVLEAEVATKNGHCVFTNFHYGKSEYPENENLLSVLNVLKKDRLKYGTK